MNISERTVEALEALYSVTFYDDDVNEVAPGSASEIHIGFDRISGEYVGKSIKAKKGEITLEWILSKVEADSIYKSFASDFNKIVNKFGLNAYPTTYGIGVFVAVGFKASISEAKDKVSEVLNSMNVKYENESSNAGWVFRYKISKSKANIERIKNN